MSINQGTPIHKIVTHDNPHFDEILAIWMLMKFGQRRYPGIQDAEIIFNGLGGEKCKEDANRLEASGILCIGVGGGRFDEHPGPQSTGFPDQCSSDLVALDLGITNDPALAPLLKFAHEADLHATGHPFDLANSVKAMHAIGANSNLAVISWAFCAIDAKYYQQKVFCKAQEIVKNSQSQLIKMHNGKKRKLIFAKTGNQEFSRAARKNNAAIVIQQQPSGNVQIFTNKKFGKTFENIVRKIRQAEAKKRQQNQQMPNFCVEGKLCYWYYHVRGQMLLNGSTNCQEDPTALSLQEIVDITKESISEGA